MDTKKKEQIRQKMAEQLTALETRIETFKKLSKPVSPDNAIGRITRMEAINSKNINEASLVKSIRTLNKLKKSITLIDNPDFGNCINCEEPIPYKRLLIMPETPFCVSCASKINHE
jgi:RNA polymerase-binding transcription factor